MAQQARREHDTMRNYLEILAELRKLASQAPPKEEWDIQKWPAVARGVRELKLEAERGAHRLTNREIAQLFHPRFSEHVIGRWLKVAQRWPTPPQDEALQQAYKHFFWKHEAAVGLSAYDMDRLSDDALKKKYLECRERRRKR
jgi:hypothetical protein